MCTLSTVPHPQIETCEFFCDSTDHDGAQVEAPYVLNGRHLCGWHFEALTYNPAAHGRW
jgi:hypothetical protein